MHSPVAVSSMEVAYLYTRLTMVYLTTLNLSPIPMKRNAFLIALLLSVTAGLSTLHAQSARDFFQEGKTLIWKTTQQGAIVGSGELQISNVANLTFDARQSNLNNPGAGLQQLYGGIFNNGQQVVLLNIGEFREVWIGRVLGDRITGKIEGGNVDFEIQPKRAQPLQWVAYNGTMPANVVTGGFENGSDLMVCRAFYNGANHPGKVVGTACNIGWGGKEIVIPAFEVLINDGQIPLQWVTYTGTIPKNAVLAGTDAGKSYYVGQFTRADGSIHAGKVFGPPGKQIFNYGYGGKEITELRGFRILVQEGR